MGKRKIGMLDWCNKKCCYQSIMAGAILRNSKQYSFSGGIY